MLFPSVAAFEQKKPEPLNHQDHFFLDLALDFDLGVGAEPLDTTLAAREVEADVALLPFFRSSSFLFYT